MTSATIARPLRAVGQQRNLLGAHLIDSLGSGLLLAFTVVYFVRTTTLGLTAIGAAITLARLLAMPTALLTGPLIDRLGARTVAAAANLLSALAYTGMLAAGRVWQIIAVVWLAQVGTAAYWTSSTGLVVLAAEEADRPRWFALIGSLRNGGLAVGAAIGALLLGVGGTGGLRAIVLLNAVSFAVAAALLATWRPARAAAVAREAVRGSYRTVLRDRRYLLLVAINLSFVFASLILSLLLAVYLTEDLHRQAWVAGSLLVLNSAQVVLTQTTVTRRLARFRPIRVIAAGSLLNALAFGLFALLSAAPGWAVMAGLYTAMLIYNAAETVATPYREDLSVSLADPGMRGRYLAVYQLSWTVGQAVAPGLLTLLLGYGGACPWLFLGALSLAAVPALLLLERSVTRPSLLSAPAAAPAGRP
ncbi:MFS transporter [Kitasatospora atroaurantiaca]|uniref:Putative MFS family arabinose efflux permease n=1 Tax=Kitasatospora atroaurantiaca TaxID=285545 RepID=A0A561ELM6_9ACTN|nr:MFS transporter [Kitasatospora atroaurantiaca]TWE16521.1 putative MFS family arabinose efflux permease [Kitasatospora atroaurantiaca]